MRKVFAVLQIPFVVMLLLLVSFRSLVPVAVGESRENEAASSLADAEKAVTMAYLAVLKVEGTGANITDLLVALNEAGLLLGRARVAFRLGNLDEAISFAALSENIGVEIQSDAVRLGNSTLSENLQSKVYTTIESVIGVVLVAFLSFWSWRVFKRRYLRRVLTMQPEVDSHES